MILMNIKIVTNEEEAKKADELLTKLIHFESDFNKNINPNYIVHNHFKCNINDNTCLAIAIQNNEIVGFIFGFIIESNAYLNKIGKIEALFVENQYRGQHIGTELIIYFKKWAKIKGVDIFEIEVLSSNKNAVDIYKKNGFKINKNTDLQKLLTLLDKNNTKANFFISYEYLEKHINEIEKEKNIEYYNYGKNGTYNDEIILIANNIISKKSNPANICLTETNTNNTLKICSENEQFTIYPEIINGTINSIKSKINNGSIISFEVTNTTLNELPLIINYINSKGYTISLLSELINEEK